VYSTPTYTAISVDNSNRPAKALKENEKKEKEKDERKTKMTTKRKTPAAPATPATPPTTAPVTTTPATTPQQPAVQQPQPQQSHRTRTPGWVYALIGLAGLALLLGTGLLWYNMYNCPSCGTVPVPTQGVAQAVPTESPTAEVPPTPIPTTVVPPTPTIPPPTPTDTPIPQLPTATLPAPAAPKKSLFPSLSYDDSDDPNCLDASNDPTDPLAVGQSTYVAFYICTAIQQGNTQSAVEDAIVKIQQDAASVGAQTWSGSSVTIPEFQAAVVWCSNATNVVVPNDTDTPLGNQHSALGEIYVIHEIGGGINGRTFSGCQAGFWAVAVK